MMNVVDLADRVAAAADLDDQARGRVTFELDYGDSDHAICIAVLETRTPLPADLLQHISDGADTYWYDQPTRDLVLAAVRRQQHAAA